MSSKLFHLQLRVRDYECDMQGIVNNAVYQNYLEHARHEFLKVMGLDFPELTRRRINLVVVRAELDYKQSLRSGDLFRVQVRLEKVSRLRFAFIQEIVRLPDKRMVLNARIIGTVLNPNGRPQFPDEISTLLNNPVVLR